MKNDYDKLCEYIPDFSQFSFLKFCQARLLISSRIFGISINDNKTDVLAPFADLLNQAMNKDINLLKIYYTRLENKILLIINLNQNLTINNYSFYNKTSF